MRHVPRQLGGGVGLIRAADCEGPVVTDLAIGIVCQRDWPFGLARLVANAVSMKCAGMNDKHGDEKSRSSLMADEDS